MPLEFLIDGATPGLISFGIGATSMSYIEWLVHKLMLHDIQDKEGKSKLGPISKNSTHSHHDIHHGAYRGNQHYYQDITNEDEVIHFSKKYVAIIESMAGLAGLAVNRVYTQFTMTDHGLNSGDITGPLGFMLAATIGYAGYEISHHYMHVIGKRRLAINNELGDAIQGTRDGNLRLSKPVLDQIGNAIEDYVDENIQQGHPAKLTVPQDLIGTVNEQIEINRQRQDVNLLDTPLEEVLVYVAEKMFKREQEIRDSLDKKDAAKYWLDRKVQKLFRGSETPIGKYFTPW